METDDMSVDDASGSAPEKEDVPLEKLIRIYRKMREKLQEMDREYTAKVEAVKVQQDSVKCAIKDIMMSLGSKSINTPSGTVILGKKTRYYTQDWDSFKRFVVENDVVDLIERRIHQTNMAKFLEENPNQVPPGLNSDTEYDISVRKPS